MTKKQKLISILILLLGSVVVWNTLLQQQVVEKGWLERGKNRLTAMLDGQESKPGFVPEQQVELKPVVPEGGTSLVQDKVTLLNDQGVALVLEKKYWQGMYLFHQAIELDSSRIEPLLNMAVTLAEVNLNQPSDRYFSLAESLDSEYPLLQKNRRDMYYANSQELSQYPLAEALEREQNFLRYRGLDGQ